MHANMVATQLQMMFQVVRHWLRLSQLSADERGSIADSGTGRA